MIAFTKTKLPFGWLGNMSPHPVIHEGKTFRTAEALFQALRFKDEVIIRQIQEQKSPMGAKFAAKAHQESVVVKPGSPEDVANMELVLRAKVSEHPDLKEQLLATGEEPIVEDVTSRMGGRNLFWGAGRVNGEWVGENVLGKLWQTIRNKLRSEDGCP